MSPGKELSQRLLETDKFDKALDALKAVKSQRSKSDALVSELKHGVEVRKALAQLGHNMSEIESLIPRGLITQMSNTRAQRFNVDWRGAQPDDIVGARLLNGEEVFFSRPIKPHAEQATPMATDPFNPSGTHRSTTHSNMVRDIRGDDWKRVQDTKRGLFKR